MSAVVLPVRLRAPEHWQQGLMFDPEELARLLFEAAEINRQTAHLLNVSIRQRKRQPPTQPRPWRPANERFRTYVGFRTAMLELERKLPSTRKPNKTNICGLGADSPKTVTRVMRHYHLNPQQWPPTTWPEQEPPA